MAASASSETRDATPPIDPKAFRQALGTFATGVTVVTSREPGGEPRGFTANSFTSVSLDPPLILVCIAKTAASHPVFSQAEAFAVSVLAETQKDVSGLFASKAPDKFARAAWHPGITGSPLIDDAAAFFDCRMHRVVEAGDHDILIGEVVSFGATHASPLGYCRGAYLTFSLSQEAVAAAEHHARVGAILEQDGAIVLMEAPDGRLDLPTGTSLEPASDPRSLSGVLNAAGIDARLGFLFAVYEEKRQPALTAIVYRGTVEALAPRGPARLFPLDALPYDRLRDDATRSMLQRFVRERAEAAFGVYVGDRDSGTVQALAQPASAAGSPSSRRPS